MAELALSFTVGATLRLPGLGLLVLSTEPVPDWLANYALHTVFAVISSPSTQSTLATTTGTLEEISYSDQLPRRGLLLDFDSNVSLVVGNCLQIREAIIDFN